MVNIHVIAKNWIDNASLIERETLLFFLGTIRPHETGRFTGVYSKSFEQHFCQLAGGFSFIGAFSSLGTRRICDDRLMWARTDLCDRRRGYCNILADL